MRKDRNIIFMGTPQFAVESLKKIHESDFNVRAVVCPPDRPAGRGQKLQSCDVKRYALTQNLKILQPKKLKDPQFLDELKEFDADVFVVVAFRMLPKEVWSMPKKGTFNIHASLLPDYRGAAPIHWAVMNGETKTGVTSFLIDEKIDTGAILLSKSCEINENETVGDVHDRLMTVGANLALETCTAIFDNTIQASKQNQSVTDKKAPKLFKNNCKIDWSKSTVEIYNHIRGLSPYPIAWTEFVLTNGETLSLKIFKSSFSLESTKHKIGEIESTKKGLKIFTKDGAINLLEIQIPGKKKMDILSFLNGIDTSKYVKAR
jgi:methionyl-tRNA formyltransferase